MHPHIIVLIEQNNNRHHHVKPLRNLNKIKPRDIFTEVTHIFDNKNNITLPVFRLNLILLLKFSIKEKNLQASLNNDICFPSVGNYACCLPKRCKMCVFVKKIIDLLSNFFCIKSKIVFLLPNICEINNY